MRCRICRQRIAMDVSSCSACGAPADERAFCGEPSQCTACRVPLWSLTRVCIHCGTAGYPALRVEVAMIDAQPPRARPGSRPLRRFDEDGSLGPSLHHRRPSAREPNRVMP